MSLILGSLMWRLLMDDMEKKLYQIISEFDITIKQGLAFLTSWNAARANLNCPFLKNRWNHLDSRRSMTRVFYECLTNIPSGYITKAALDIKNDPLLDAKTKAKLLTEDHVMSGQAWGCFVIAKYEELFKDDFPAFIRECITASPTVICTVEENNKCKSFTVNDNTTGGILRLRVPTESRYEAAGINILWDINKGETFNGFPFKLSDAFLEYQKDHLLIS